MTELELKNTTFSTSDSKSLHMRAKVNSACSLAGISLSQLAQQSGLSEETLTRIISGDQTPKATELLMIADATGFTLSELMDDTIAGRVEMSASSSKMQERLLHFIEMDAYLDEQNNKENTDD